MALGDYWEEWLDLNCVSTTQRPVSHVLSFCPMHSIIGEDKALSIKIGSQAKMSGDNTLHEDAILVRGPTRDVTRAIEAIKQLAEKAKNDEIESSYVRVYTWFLIS